MRAIIDADGLGLAVSYYRMFPREPGRQPADDMTIDRIDELHDITMLAVLGQLTVAAGRREREVLVVAHGEPRGFLMPIAPGGVSAMKDALDAVMSVAAVLERRDRIRAEPAATRLASWTRFIEELAPGTISGTISLQEAERWFEQQWLPNQARNVRLRPAVLEDLVRRMRQVQQAGLDRVEIRACNIGQDADALRALRLFLGAARVCAPNVGTFYVGVDPVVSADQRRLADWTRRLAGPLPRSIYGRDPAPPPRTFESYVPAPHGMPLGFVVTEGFTLRVWETSRRPHRYASMAAAADWARVAQWVDLNIMSNSSYRTGRFILAGMWTFAPGLQPFVTPTDPAYRATIVCSTR